jgi:ribosomal protein S26
MLFKIFGLFFILFHYFVHGAYKKTHPALFIGQLIIKNSNSDNSMSDLSETEEKIQKEIISMTPSITPYLQLQQAKLLRQSKRYRSSTRRISPNKMTDISCCSDRELHVDKDTSVGIDSQLQKYFDFNRIHINPTNQIEKPEKIVDTNSKIEDRSSQYHALHKTKDNSTNKISKKEEKKIELQSIILTDKKRISERPLNTQRFTKKSIHERNISCLRSRSILPDEKYINRLRSRSILPDEKYINRLRSRSILPDEKYINRLRSRNIVPSTEAVDQKLQLPSIRINSFSYKQISNEENDPVEKKIKHHTSRSDIIGEGWSNNYLANEDVFQNDLIRYSLRKK